MDEEGLSRVNQEDEGSQIRHRSRKIPEQSDAVGINGSIPNNGKQLILTIRADQMTDDGAFAAVELLGGGNAHLEGDGDR
jgi:hypothetical protein